MSSWIQISHGLEAVSFARLLLFVAVSLFDRSSVSVLFHLVISLGRRISAEYGSRAFFFRYSILWFSINFPFFLLGCRFLGLGLGFSSQFLAF